MMKASDLGLDTLVMGVRDEMATRNALDIPSNEIIMGIIALGYRDIEPSAPKRRELDVIAKFI